MSRSVSAPSKGDLDAAQRICATCYVILLGTAICRYRMLALWIQPTNTYFESQLSAGQTNETHGDSEQANRMKNTDDEVNWTAITARCLAYLCLKNSRYDNKSILEQAQFLEKLGLPIDDQAGIVGSTPASLRELARQAKAKKRSKKNAKVSG